MRAVGFRACRPSRFAIQLRSWSAPEKVGLAALPSPDALRFPLREQLRCWGLFRQARYSTGRNPAAACIRPLLANSAAHSPLPSVRKPVRAALRGLTAGKLRNAGTF